MSQESADSIARTELLQIIDGNEDFMYYAV
jgi:hypothetical protein